MPAATAQRAVVDTARAPIVEVVSGASATGVRMTSDQGTASLTPCEDRRITRSKAAIHEAFIELVEEKGLDGFSVNDLCQRAGLNRGTFYNHFHDKEHLLATYEDEVIDGFEVHREQLKKLSLLKVARYAKSKKALPELVAVFDYLRSQSDFLHAIVGPGGDAGFRSRLSQAVCHDFIISVLHERYRENPTPFVEYYIAFYSAAYMGIISRWIETGMQESSEEMARIALRLLFIKPGESIVL